MPTILRRFSSRLRQHDWTAVFIELAIVMVGVFLGIEAANWNQARLDRGEERRVYRQLIEDLRADQHTLQVAIGRSRRHDRAAEHVLAALRSDRVPGSDAAAFAVDVHKAGFLYLPRPARRTYDELVGTGSLRLLRDETAKEAIAGYYATFDSNRQFDVILREQQSDYWRLTAGVVPRHVLQAAIRGRAPNVTADEAATFLASAKRRPQVADMLIGMAAHQERVRRDSEEQSKLASDLIRRLEPLAR